MKNIRLDKTGICINGEYRILLASSLFYFRIPKERWNDRMLLLKAAGYHAIDVYFPWNFHETSPGNWDFSQNRDVEEFLRLAARNELFVIARPGPYICSEWDGGAIPAWLWEKGIAVRQDDPAFLQEIGNWYGRILPILAKYQIGREGTVVCMQIENELDFYHCVSPVSYMEKLKAKAEACGIEVPLFYCCGQNDLLRGGGLTPGLYTAFNVYADGSNRNLEERAFHLYTSVQERNMPLLITETNREHGFLKRLLACGARLLSPYNQTAGATMDFYNSISNWGTPENPISLMASDYDFRSMIGSAGEVDRQFLEARLLSGLLYSLGESIAAAKPAHASRLHLISKEPVNTLLPMLELPEGNLFAVSNLGNAGTVTILEDSEGQEKETALQVDMGTAETRLLPWHFRISPDCELIICSYEIGWIDKSAGHTEVCLYGSGRLECLISGENGQIRVCRDTVLEHFRFQYGSVSFSAGSPEAMASGHVPGLPDMKRKLSEQKKEGSISRLSTSGCSLQCREPKDTSVLPMEKAGQYRGIGCYRFHLPLSGEHLLSRAADFVTINNGSCNETFYSNGNCSIHSFQDGKLEIFTEIWGHSNFDDIRCESLRMGSLKGIEGLVRLERREDISESWLLDMDEMPWEDTYFFRHSPCCTISGIDGYNRALSPLKTVYARYIESGPGEDSLFLHFEKADCIIGVYANNRYMGMIQKDNPYLDLSSLAGSGRIELTVRTVRRYYSDLAGRVTLLGGTRIRECQYGEALPVPAGEKESCSLPFRMKKGENRFFWLSLEECDSKNVKLFLKGNDIKLTFYSGGRVAGRILLQKENMPIVAGGRRDVVYLCGEWLKEAPVQIWCQATGEHPVLEEITAEEYTSVI